MYALMVRFLAGMLAIAFVLALADKVPFEASAIATTTLVSVVSCYVFNLLLARFFKVRPNPESWLISSLILALIVGPASLSASWLPLLIAAAAAMASKYLLRFKSRHIFNPAAVGVVTMYLTTGTGASWWIGVMPLTVLVVAGAILIGYKIRRLKMAVVYIVAFLLLFFTLNGTGLPLSDNAKLIEGLLLNSPLFFFALVMLPEPATSPANHRLGYAYAVLIAFGGVAIQRFLPSIPYSLELSLLLGNILARVVEKIDYFTMTLVKQDKLAPTIELFTFEPQPKVNFVPGQFLEWTLPHSSPDSRGVRRWFTISSSPTEKLLLLTTRFADKSSSFKTALRALKPHQQVFARGLEGDFVMPSDKTKPLVFIAGGIGITPFRSMIKYLVDSGERRDIILIYATKTAEDLVFMDLFHEASEAFGLKIVTVVSNPPENWSGYKGQISPAVIKEEVPDLLSQLFYVSGPEPMVEALSQLLGEMGVPRSNIRQDFFPGYTNDLLTKK